jgi:methylase of polypeptide subunit release factors
MCQISHHEVPLRMFVHSLSQSIRQVKENAGCCRQFLSGQDHELNAAFLSAEQTAALLQSQLEQIVRDLEIREGKPPQQTIITYFDGKNDSLSDGLREDAR